MAETPPSPIKSSIAAALRETATPPSPPPAAPPAAASAAPAGSAPSSAPPPSELVTIKLDGRDVQAKKGANLLEVCLANGVDVSYFCYHPGLSSPAVCRQCLVEVVGQPKLVPACFTPIADKMEVNTATPRVLSIRRQILEFTLVNHPVDCPICDKAGECTLQKQYQDWDHEGSRSSIPKVHKPKMQDLGPHIVLDAERCILCTRCIRVCDEVAGEKQLTMAWRGDREQLTVAPGHKLDNPYSINTVDVCPVGALTSKDFASRCGRGSCLRLRRCVLAVRRAVTSKCITRKAKFGGLCLGKTSRSTSTGCATKAALLTKMFVTSG